MNNNDDNIIRNPNRRRSVNQQLLQQPQIRIPASGQNENWEAKGLVTRDGKGNILAEQKYEDNIAESTVANIPESLYESEGLDLSNIAIGEYILLDNTNDILCIGEESLIKESIIKYITETNNSVDNLIVLKRCSINMGIFLND